jgi:HAD superfamily hydrolase (TIGR01509 family)
MKAVIFDCDGTLVDSEILSNEVLVEAVAEHGILLSVDDAVRSFRGCKLADCVSQLEARLGRPLPADFVASLRTRTAAAFRSRLRAVDGAVELVRSLSQPACVASSGPMDKVELSLSLTGLLPYFEGRIFSSYEVGSWKPDPDLLLHAARAMGVTPAECAVVEDSLPGIRAGIAAGMTVFAFQPHGVDPTIPGQVTIVKELLELRSILRRGGAEAASPIR